VLSRDKVIEPTVKAIVSLEKSSKIRFGPLHTATVVSAAAWTLFYFSCRQLNGARAVLWQKPPINKHA